MACQLEPPKRSPVLLAARREPARCRACQPSAAAPRPRPLRCGLTFYKAHHVKAAQEAGQGGEGALVGAKRRALTGVLPLGSRTEAASEKGQRGLTLDYT